MTREEEMQRTLSHFIKRKEVIDLTIEEPIEQPAIKGSKSKSCPFYKVIPGTTFTMDAFSYGTIEKCTAYFLSHFHADHYTRLSKSFAHPIYCTPITANLVQLRIGVAKEYIHTIPFNTPTIVQGVTVTIYDANHCPGSGIFVFDIPKSSISRTLGSYRLPNKDVVVLHTGDFRAHPTMLEAVPSHIDYLFLDTTYLNPKYTFMTQSEVATQTAQVLKKLFRNEPVYRQTKRQKKLENQTTLTGKVLNTKSVFQLDVHDKVVVIVGAYVIGKEKMAVHLADSLNSLIYVTSDRYKVWECFENEHMLSYLTKVPSKATVHIVRMNQLNPKTLQDYINGLPFTKVIGIRPTGWTHSANPFAPAFISPTACLFEVPYSEHSSFSELQAFVSRLDVTHIHPTVNMRQVKQQNDILSSWKKESSTWSFENDIFGGKSIC